MARLGSLTKTGEIVIVTKSLKDVMAITNITGIPQYLYKRKVLQLKAHIIEELKSRFDMVFILYDNKL
jgi:hypothetical protein